MFCTRENGPVILPQFMRDEWPRLIRDTTISGRNDVQARNGQGIDSLEVRVGEFMPPGHLDYVDSECGPVGVGDWAAAFD